MRLNYRKIAQEGYKQLLAVLEYVNGAGLEASLIHLVYLRVSQINGCSYCVDHHWADAVKIEVDQRKLNAVCVWRDTPFFTDREKAALGWAESVTFCRKENESQVAYEEMLEFFDEKELTDLTIAIAQINAFNRIAIAFHVTPA